MISRSPLDMVPTLAFHRPSNGEREIRPDCLDTRPSWFAVLAASTLPAFDANNDYGPIRVGRAFRELGFFCFEKPVYDHERAIGDGAGPRHHRLGRCARQHALDG